MKRSRIGNITVDTDKIIFVCVKPFSQMKQSEIRLYSYLDLLQEKAGFAQTKQEENSIYSEMDKLFCIASIVDQLGDNTEQLYNSVYYFTNAVNNGAFNKKFDSLQERNDNLNNVTLSIVNDTLNNVSINNSIVTPSISDWWNENIMNLNYYTNSDGEKVNSLPTVSIGATNDNYLERFKQGAPSWCYSVVDPDFLGKNSIAKIKRSKQIEMRKSLDACGVQLDFTTQTNLIHSGIMAQSDGATATEFINAMKASAKEQRAKIGMSEAGITALINAIASLLATCIPIVVGLIISAKQKKNNADTALNNAENKLASVDDWLDIDGDGVSDAPKLLIGGAVLLALYYFFG